MPLGAEVPEDALLDGQGDVPGGYGVLAVERPPEAAVLGDAVVASLDEPRDADLRGRPGRSRAGRSTDTRRRCGSSTGSVC